MNQDSGLVKRGLVLLALMSALVVVLLTIVLQRNPGTVPSAGTRADLGAGTLLQVSAPFPASVAWAGLYQTAEALPSPPGWEIRYNAAATLARLGKANVPWPILQEMLDEERQMRNFRVQLQDGKNVPDESAARTTMLVALRAIAEWHRKQASGDREVSAELAKVYAAVDRLAQSPLISLKTEAEKTRKTFFR